MSDQTTPQEPTTHRSQRDDEQGTDAVPDEEKPHADLPSETGGTSSDPANTTEAIPGQYPKDDPDLEGEDRFDAG